VHLSFFTFFRVLSIFQVLECAFIIFHVIQVFCHIPCPSVCDSHLQSCLVFSPKPRSYSENFSLFMFSMFLPIFPVLQIMCQIFHVFQVPQHIPVPTVCTSHFPCFSMFLLIFQVLQCLCLIFHIFFLFFSPYSRSYIVHFSFSRF
jgi:hypothetical protein